MKIPLGRRLGAMSRLGKRLRHDQRGATAVEFALISVPFFMLLFGIFSVCQAFFWIFTAENAVVTAARDIRTGLLQTGATGSVYAQYYTNGSLTNANGLYSQFLTQICKGTVNPTDCSSNSVVLVQSNTTGFGSITAPNCLDNSSKLLSTTAAQAAFSAGAASSIVLVTLCYSWSAGASMPFLPLPKISGGGYLIQASAAFRTEPY